MSARGRAGGARRGAGRMAQPRCPAEAGGGRGCRGPVPADARHAGGGAGARRRRASLGPADWAAVRFTLLQAALSAALSVALAVPVARALARRRFPGRGAADHAAGRAVPAAGDRGGAGAAGGLRPVGAAEPRRWRRWACRRCRSTACTAWCWRMCSSTCRWRCGCSCRAGRRSRPSASGWPQSLGFGPREMFRHLERPMLRAVLPGALLAIFLICLTSFAVVLTLGGGPRGHARSNWRSIRRCGSTSTSAARPALAVLQFAICGAAVALAAWLALPRASAPGWTGRAPAAGRPGAGGAVVDALVIGGAALFLLLPLAADRAARAAGAGATCRPGLAGGAAVGCWWRWCRPRCATGGGAGAGAGGRARAGRALARGGGDAAAGGLGAGAGHRAVPDRAPLASRRSGWPCR